MIYTVTFNPALDYVVQVPAFQSGIVNRSSYETIQYGGKGINVSYILNQLNVPNIALGFIAGFTGHEIQQRLQNDGIQTDFIELPEGLSRINIKLKTTEETEINASGPAIGSSELLRLYDQLQTLSSGDILVLAGSIPNSLPSNLYEQIMSMLSDRGIFFVVDASRDLLTKVLKYHPFLIKPNHHELSEIFGVQIQTEQEIIHYAKQLQSLGARNVLVSRGKEGAVLVQEDGSTYSMGVAPGKVLNSVGSGDSMVAGFLAGWCTTKNYQNALRLGSAAGNATAFSIGLGTKDKIEEMLSLLPK